MLRTFKPRLITGYAVGIEKMAEYLVQNGIKVEPPKAVVCGAMDVTDHCRDLRKRSTNRSHCRRRRSFRR